MILLSAIAVGTTSLLLAYCLPTASMQDHMRDSSIVFQNEGTYPVASLACSRVLDNFTAVSYTHLTLPTTPYV